jgi:TM2 domain-containing membrane protein YozV
MPAWSYHPIENKPMTTKHKNKTIATFLAATLGSVGAHRFYLFGKRDQFAWLHLISLPISLLLANLLFNLPLLLTMSPWALSLLTSLFTALALGLKSDEKWDAHYNPESNQKSDSTWPLALILVLTMAFGAFALIFVLARGFALLYTGGVDG